MPLSRIYYNTADSLIKTNRLSSTFVTNTIVFSLLTHPSSTPTVLDIDENAQHVAASSSDTTKRTLSYRVRFGYYLKYSTGATRATIKPKNTASSSRETPPRTSGTSPMSCNHPYQSSHIKFCSGPPRPRPAFGRKTPSTATQKPPSSSKKTLAAEKGKSRAANLEINEETLDVSDHEGAIPSPKALPVSLFPPEQDGRGMF